MRPTRLVALAILIVMSMLLIPGGVTAQGNSEAAHACQNGGYLRYDSGGGVPFTNVGQCVRHVAQGNDLVLRELALFIKDGQNLALFPSPHDGVVSGTGFTPHSPIVVLHGVGLQSGISQSLITSVDPLVTDASGAFATTPRLWFCAGGDTAIEITATDAAGVTHTESFILDCQ